jgi:hypothetical protein
LLVRCTVVVRHLLCTGHPGRTLGRTLGRAPHHLHIVPLWLAGERVKRFDIQCCTAVPGATSGYTPWCDVHQEVVRDVTAERTIGTAPPQPTRRFTALVGQHT